MMAKRGLAFVIGCAIACPALAQEADNAVLVEVRSGVEIEYVADRNEARRELAAKVEMAARMACTDSWRPRTTIFESIDYQIDWAGGDAARPERRRAIARNISVRCRL